jgi:hypothetical protein
MGIYKTNGALSEMRDLLEYYVIKYGMTSKEYDAILYSIDAGIITSVEQLKYRLVDITN